MRFLPILASAVTLGLAAGYVWSAMPPAKASAHVPRAVDATPPPIRESSADDQWAMRADDPATPEVERAAPDPTHDKTAVEQSVYYPSCAAARAAGHAPIFAGQPGYRAALDADGDGIACEPYRSS